MEAGIACQRAIYVETREKTVRYMVSQIDGYLMVQRSYKVSSYYTYPRLPSVNTVEADLTIKMITE